MRLDFTAASADRLELGEGVAWYGEFLLVDLLAGRLLTLAEDGLRELLRLDVPLGAAAPTEDGRLIVAAGDGVALVGEGAVTWLGRPEADAPVPMRMNDGTTDPRGRFWATSMPYDGTPGAGSLYRVGADGEAIRALGGLTIPNGPAFVAGGDRLYLADSARGLILTAEIDPESGELGGCEEFARVEEGSPDGMIVDAEGFLWSAVWGAGRLHRYAPDGHLVDVVEVPARQPTRMAISPAGVMVVTTAAFELSAPGPLDGAVLVADAGVAGTALPPYRS